MYEPDGLPGAVTRGTGTDWEGGLGGLDGGGVEVCRRLCMNRMVCLELLRGGRGRTGKGVWVGLVTGGVEVAGRLFMNLMGFPVLLRGGRGRTSKGPGRLGWGRG